MFKEQNRWKTEKLRLEQTYEAKILELQNEMKELQSRNEGLEMECDTLRRSILPPDPPSREEQGSLGWDGNISEITTRLSTIFGTELTVNPAQLQQSIMFLSRMKSSGGNNSQLMATNEVLQTDLDRLQTEMKCKENLTQKLSIENEKLKKQSSELMRKLDRSYDILRKVYFETVG